MGLNLSYYRSFVIAASFLWANSELIPFSNFFGTTSRKEKKQFTLERRKKYNLEGRKLTKTMTQAKSKAQTHIRLMCLKRSEDIHQPSSKIEAQGRKYSQYRSFPYAPGIDEALAYCAFFLKYAGSEFAPQSV